ncbi:gas vesicle protein GvpO [Pseudonocardia sp. RS010]|uniref:gas vesicle protein GvpO n=1 Tax=Pseudonocardia sp. RS010 TaxID=3385979 RepID=UPI0039A2B64C
MAESKSTTTRRRRSAPARSAGADVRAGDVRAGDVRAEDAGPEEVGPEDAGPEDVAVEDVAVEDVGAVDVGAVDAVAGEGGARTGGPEEDDGSAGHPDGTIVRIARRAAEQVGVLTGRHPETVISIEPRDGDWCVGVEVVEAQRIPDTTDVLAIYEALVRPDGDLISCRRARRYSRDQVDRPWH